MRPFTLADKQRRWDSITRLRAEGKTYKQIGAELGISGTRVFAMLKELERHKAREANKCDEFWPNFTYSLPIRAANCLNWRIPRDTYFHVTESKESFLAWLDTVDLMKVRNCGRKTIKDIYDMLGLAVPDRYLPGYLRPKLRQLELFRPCAALPSGAQHSPA